MNNHLSNHRLQEYIDGAVGMVEAARIADHLNTCVPCSKLHTQLEAMHLALRREPLESAGSEFAHNVLKQLNIIPRTPLSFRVAENFAYVFGMLIVLVVTVGVLVFTGAIGEEDVVRSQTVFSQNSKEVGRIISMVSGELTTRLENFAPFVFKQASLRIGFLSTLIVGALMLLDRLLRRRFM